ncbi:MAG: hypothetical protein HYY41_06885 [Chloroflexi bacterium]|nr:hypothetical protein [Chloroflexota bacterium]MBI2980525.1 hypothetical protein [Chloroflexota bacterium]
MIYFGTFGFSRIRQLDSIAEKTFIFANNHWRGQAVGTIRQLRAMLD